jgi:mersacidin/lichenicidin family type 2 lantibiotic
MSYQDIIRAWKDEEYRLSLSEEQHAVLPEHHPAGLMELVDKGIRPISLFIAMLVVLATILGVIGVAVLLGSV